jgi:phospholipase/carboxylesterase
MHSVPFRPLSAVPARSTVHVAARSPVQTARVTARITIAVALGAALAACDVRRSTEPVENPNLTAGRLTARIVAPTKSAPAGLTVQRLSENGRPFGMYVPSTYDPAKPAAVTVLLHGSGSSGEEMALNFKDYAEAANLVILAPNSRAPTWDLILFNQFGADLLFMDAMLKWAFDRINVDPARLSISGFSDGATYAVWVGLKNGDLFSRLAAFTPCTTIPRTRTGMPEVFVSHGLDDTVAPIETCSRTMVPNLEEAGYDVLYVEYPAPEGNGHFMTPPVITQGMDWLSR